MAASADAQGQLAAGWSELAARLDLEEVRALFERLALSALGRRAVRELAPLGEAQARAAYARLAEVQSLERGGERPPLGGTPDPRSALDAARRFGRGLERGELADLGAFLAADERVRAWVEERKDALPASHAVARKAPDLARVRERVATSVDERGEVRDSASPALARLRSEARALDARIAQRIDELVASVAVRQLLSDVGVHRRSGRRVLAVKLRSAGRVHGLVHDRSHSGETVFVEPRETLELGNQLAQRESEARAEEQRLVVELTRELLAHAERIAEAAAALGELELALLSAEFCKQYGARAPELVDPSGGGGLLLRAARHPLLVEQQRRAALAEVVPIDVRLGEEFDLLVVTGPNTGGKTLALKTVGVAVWCARHALPVCCAENSRVPLYDAAAADVGDGQEIRQNLSTFASHLVRIRAALARASPRTLLLFDELGGGTDPDEGAALGYALLEHLLDRGVPTIVTTHIGKLKELAFRRARAENASVAFDARTRRPLYRLEIGTPGESNALAIAAELGLPEVVLARARERLERRDAELELLMEDVRGARESAERLRREAEARVVDLERQRGEADERARGIAERGERLEAEAQRSVEERVAGARRLLQGGRPLLDQIAAPAAGALREVLDQAEAELSGAALSERRQAFLASLDKGQLVYVPRYRQRCVVKRVDRSRQILRVLVGKLTVDVPFDEVTWYDHR
jgi:DNA mismatch repair protein MutS2